MEAELFSSLHRQRLENGISRLSIHFRGNPMGASRTAHCFAILLVNSTGPPITAAKTALAPFTSCLPGKPASGTSESFTVFKTEATGIVLSAILFVIPLAIFSEPQVKAG